MTDRYDELRAAAEAATPGPWRQTRTHRLIGNGYGAPWVCEVDSGHPKFEENSAFIALANPETIKALLSDLAGANAYVETFNGQVRKVYDENQALTLERDSLLAALKEAESVFALVERPAFVDPQHSETIRQLGERIGYGALMASASASWREKLSSHRPGGEFVAGPCHSTVIATLKTIRAALTTTEG